MTRLLGRWIVLAPAMWLAVASVLWFGFRTIDLRFEVFAALMIVPALQAVALTWAIAGPPRALARVPGTIARLPFGATAAIVDSGMVLAGLILWSRSRLGFGFPGSLQVVWAATKAGAAGVILVMARDRRFSGRRLAAGVAAIAIGISGFADWLGEAPAFLVSLIGRLPLVLAYLLAYGSGVALVVVLLIRLGRMWPPNSVGRLLVESCVAAVLMASLVLVLNGFKYKVPMEPYRGVALLAASLAASALLYAAETPDSEA